MTNNDLNTIVQLLNSAYKKLGTREELTPAETEALKYSIKEIYKKLNPTYEYPKPTDEYPKPINEYPIPINEYHKPINEYPESTNKYPVNDAESIHKTSK